MRVRIVEPIRKTLDLRHLTNEDKGRVQKSFWANVHTKRSDGCWRFGQQRPLMPRRAGHVYWCGTSWSAHRFSWALHHGSLEEGLYLWHSCRVMNCVNPAHLIYGCREEMLAWHDARRQAD